MGTISRLPEKVRNAAPVIGSENEAFEGVHALVRHLAPAGDMLDILSAGSLSLSAVSSSGLLGITVPGEHGGADISNAVLAEIVATTGSASQTAASWLTNHFQAVEMLRASPSSAASSFFYARALVGELFFIVGDLRAGDEDFMLVAEASGPGLRLSGKVAVEIDPMHADWIVASYTDETGDYALFIPRMSSGLRLTPDEITFRNLHVDADCVVKLASAHLSTTAPLGNLLHAAQKIGAAEARLSQALAAHNDGDARWRMSSRQYLSSLGLAVSRIENGKAALERAGLKLDTAQVNADEDSVQAALFSSTIALSSAAEASDLAAEIGTGNSASRSRTDPYGHAPIGAQLLEARVH